MEIYDLRTWRWNSNTLPELQVARSHASSCSHSGYIYIFGGAIISQKKFKMLTNVIERFNLSHYLSGARSSTD